MKQDYFTRDTHKPVTHKRVGSEVRESLAGKFTKALNKKKVPEKRYSPEDEEDETEDDRRYDARVGKYDSARYHAH